MLANDLGPGSLSGFSAPSALGSGTKHPLDENPVGALDIGGFPHTSTTGYEAGWRLKAAQLTDNLLNGLSIGLSTTDAALPWINPFGTCSFGCCGDVR